MDLTKLSAYDYHLPNELIAQTAHEPADECKLLYCKVDNEIELKDLIFKDIAKFLGSNDVLFFNNSKVVKARIVGDTRRWTRRYQKITWDACWESLIISDDWDCRRYQKMNQKIPEDYRRCLLRKSDYIRWLRL